MAGSESWQSVVDELYGVSPVEFVAARDEYVARARAADDQELADRIAALRRPTRSAWVVNLLWRERRAEVEELLELGARFREAHLRRSGERVRELSGQRQRLSAALGEQARRLAKEAGVRVGAAVVREAEGTLEAAVADPEAAERVRSGRLTKPESYAGFGPLGPDELADFPQPAKRERAAQAAARAAERVRTARADVERTEQELTEAERVLSLQTQRVARARSAHAAAEHRLRAAEAELEQLSE